MWLILVSEERPARMLQQILSASIFRIEEALHDQITGISPVVKEMLTILLGDAGRNT